MAKAGRSSWTTRALACAGAAAVALVAALAVRWERTEVGLESEDAGPTVEIAAGTPRPLESPPPLPGNDSSVAVETGRLILTGTQVAADPADSRAFLGTDPTNPQTYAVNSTLVNDARIKAIARDHILLERDGRVARVEIGGAWSEPVPAARRLIEIAPMPAEATAGIEPRPPELTDVLRISPEFDANGILTSYRLRPGRQGSVFARWGLQTGDRLVAIEGAPLTDTDTASFLLELVARGEKVHATVLRGGSRVAVLLDGNAIGGERAGAQAATAHETAAPHG